MAHGSRRLESNQEVRQLADQLRKLDHQYERIESAFLELAEPSIPDGLRTLIKAGSDHVVVLPYFLSAGRHVVTDIPNEIDVMRKEYPNAIVDLAPYLGAAPGIESLLLQADSTMAATGI